MKPYSNRNMNNKERIFNYRLSRARRVVEKTFGILAYRWRCMLGTMQQDPYRVNLIVMAAICLHNLMRLRYPGLQNTDLTQEDEAGNYMYIPGAWRNDRVLHDVEAVWQRQLAKSGGQENPTLPETLLQQRGWKSAVAAKYDIVCDIDNAYV